MVGTSKSASSTSEKSGSSQTSSSPHRLSENFQDNSLRDIDNCSGVKSFIDGAADCYDNIAKNGHEPLYSGVVQSMVHGPGE